MLRSSQYAASALQNRTRPGETGFPVDEIDAFRFTRVPAATLPSGETISVVVVGEVAASIRTGISRQNANTKYDLNVREGKKSPRIIDLQGGRNAITEVVWER